MAKQLSTIGLVRNGVMTMTTIVEDGEKQIGEIESEKLR